VRRGRRGGVDVARARGAAQAGAGLCDGRSDAHESGTIGAKPFHIPLSIGDGELAETADAVVSVPEMFNYWIHPGRIQVAFLCSATQTRRVRTTATSRGWRCCWRAGRRALHSTTLGWRIVNPKMPDQWTISLGASTEKLAGIHKVGREEQDRFALRSHQLTAKAWDDGFYEDWVVAVPDTELQRDENMRPDTSLEKLAKLKLAFVKDGTVTAGSASSLNDGAGALVIGDENYPGEPLARIVSRGTQAGDPDIFAIAPVEAANRAVENAGIDWDQVEVVELNEAFAAALFMFALDRLIVATTLPAIQHELGASLQALEWTINAFTLTSWRG
jgi:Thiolase, N-terminal domain/Thiolase, C-terminal domain